MTKFNTRIMSKRDTTESWNSVVSFVPLEGEVIIYTDHDTDSEGNMVPGLKVGDGKTPVVDLPFVDAYLREKLLEHINDLVKHITQQEREDWNNKVNCDYEEETLIINIENKNG